MQGEGRGTAPRPSLLFVTVDTLRPDALGWVSGTDATPALDTLARGGFRFPAAVSPTPLTLPAHASLMTGLYPTRHGVRDNGQVLGAGVATLAEVLRDHGYATAAFVSGYPLAGLFGLDRGFAYYDDRLTAGEGAWLERPADRTADAALAWLASARRPWFAWVHFYDPHYPYEPPAPLARPGPRGAYDGEVAAVDRALARLDGALAGLPPGELLTVFTADHGESLGDHGEGTHGFFIYDATVLVPLVLRWPGRIEPGESAAAARLVDVAPTLLDLLGLPPPSPADGRSLAPLMAGHPLAPAPAYVETLQPWNSYGWAPLAGVRHEGWKLIAAPRPELYHLVRAPGESRNLVGEEREKAVQLLAMLRALTPAETAATGSVEDPEARARLQALGYLGAGGAGALPPPGAELADPKDRAAMRQALTEADALLRRGDWRGALARFEAALADEPDNRFALARSGIALLQSGETRRAAERLQRAVAADPAQPEVRAALAETLTRLGDPEAALPHWRQLTRLQPRRAFAWSNLGTALGRAGRPAEAAQALRRALELEPESPDRHLRLAFAQHAAGDLAAAAQSLEEAAHLLGPDRFAHAGALGLILAELGRGAEARDWLARSRPGEGDFARARLALARLEADAGRTEAARRALAEALAAAPALRREAAADPLLAPLIAGRGAR